MLRALSITDQKTDMELKYAGTGRFDFTPEELEEYVR